MTPTRDKPRNVFSPWARVTRVHTEQMSLGFPHPENAFCPVYQQTTLCVHIPLSWISWKQIHSSFNKSQYNIYYWHVLIIDKHTKVNLSGDNVLYFISTQICSINIYKCMQNNWVSGYFWIILFSYRQKTKDAKLIGWWSFRFQKKNFFLHMIQKNFDASFMKIFSHPQICWYYFQFFFSSFGLKLYDTCKVFFFFLIWEYSCTFMWVAYKIFHVFGWAPKSWGFSRHFVGCDRDSWRRPC